MRIAYVHGVCVKNDAISNAIRDEVTWLVGAGHAVKLYAYRCDFPDIPHQTVSQLRDVAFDEHFQASDLVVFHFGVFYPLFNLLPVVPQRAKKVVVFHNITPKAFLPESAHDLIDRSFGQMYNIVFADHVVCDSQTNEAVLREAGIATPSIVLPLALSLSAQSPPAKPSFFDGVTRVAFVGRFVTSKGPDEVLDAIDAVLQRLPQAVVSVDMVGNLDFSDATVVSRVKELMQALQARHGARLRAQLHGNASDQEKGQILSAADVFVLPTRHEGFCVPILEAFASGCCVVSYDNSNVPAIAGGLASLVPTGDLVALASTLERVTQQTGSDIWRVSGYAAYRVQTRQHLRTFAPETVEQRFVEFVTSLV